TRHAPILLVPGLVCTLWNSDGSKVRARVAIHPKPSVRCACHEARCSCPTICARRCSCAFDGAASASESGETTPTSKIMNNKFDALKDDDSGDHEQDNSPPKDGEKEKNENEEKDQNTTKRKAVVPGAGEHPLQYNYTFWYSRRTPGRPASTQSYEQNIKQIGSFASVEQFWRFYSHMIRPGDLTGHSDFHLFKEGIKPMWEDEANKSGGKWIIRLRKGLASRCWENLILAMLGEQFMVGEEICGAVVSVRFQ
ncbi:hypothetical protein P4O66_021158, partial [Electrophorus voltai]